MRCLAPRLYSTQINNPLGSIYRVPLLKKSRTFLRSDIRPSDHAQNVSKFPLAHSRLFLTTTSVPKEDVFREPLIASSLPRTCPGCGAYSQTVSLEEAGFYTATRKPVQAFVASQRALARQRLEEEAHTYATAVAHADQNLLRSLGLDHDSQTIEGTILPSVALSRRSFGRL